MNLPLASSARPRMERSLKKILAPHLRTLGFRGSFPYYRRWNGDIVDMVMVYFDKYGGGFWIELARGHYPDDAPSCNERSKVTVAHMPFELRRMIAPQLTEGFRYDTHGILPTVTQCDSIAQSALGHFLREAPSALDSIKAEPGGPAKPSPAGTSAAEQPRVPGAPVC